MTNKRVLIIAHNHPSILAGGAQVFAYDLFQALNKKRFIDAFFLSSATGKSSIKSRSVFYTINQNINEVIMCGQDYDSFNHLHLNSDHIYIDFKNFIRSYRPEIIHLQHFFHIGLEIISVIKQALPKTKIILTFQEYLLICNRMGQMVRTINNEELCTHASPERCHECFPEITKSAFRAREVFIKSHLELIDQFIAPSRFIAQRFIEWGLPRKKIKVLDYGRVAVTPAPHRQIKGSGYRNHFAYFGQINPYKGVILLLQASQLLLKSGFTNWQLDIFGGLELGGHPDLDLAFRHYLSSLKSHVHYHGSYQSKDLARLITPIDWVIVPSTGWENSPLVIQEAFMHRRPVITSNISGMAEKVQNEVDGLHFEVNYPLSLAETIKRAGTDNKLWNKLVANIKPPMTIDECAQRHVALYDQLLKGKQKA